MLEDYKQESLPQTVEGISPEALRDFARGAVAHNDQAERLKRQQEDLAKRPYRPQQE